MLRLKDCLSTALGDERLAHADLDAPLLESGLISSLELVLIQTAMEQAYDLRVPAARAVELSLNDLLSLTCGESPATPSPPQRRSSLQRVLRRPVRLLLLVALCFLLLDMAVEFAIEQVWPQSYRRFIEHGQRLSPLPGATQDDLAFAVSQHEIQRSRARQRVVVFGDSGTIGSYVDPQQALPAQLERALADRGLQLKVFNLAYYGRMLVKDLIVLELVWDQPIDLALFTVSEVYLTRRLQDWWAMNLRHISFNWPLFERFIRRVPPAERPPFREMLAALKKADSNHYEAPRRFAFRYFAYPHYAPFLRDQLTERLLPRQMGSKLRRRKRVMPRKRYALGRDRGGMFDSVARTDIDHRQLRILRTVIRMLARRGVPTVLFVAPVGPRQWSRPLPADRVSATPYFQRLGVPTVDLKWALDREDFIDSASHWTADAIRRMAEPLAETVAATLKRRKR